MVSPYHGGMSHPTGLPAASEDQVRASSDELLALAKRHGLSRLRVSSSGRIVASVEDGRGYIDVVRYEREADAVLGAHVDVVSDDVLDDAADAKLRTACPL